VARVGHVGVDPAVGTVSASPLLGGLVDLDVLDDEVAGVEALGVGVGLGVLEQTEKELGGLDWPAGLGDTELLALCASSSASSVPPHGHGFLVLDYILKVGNGAAELPAIDRLGSLPGVLERDTEIGTAGASGLRVVDTGCSVSDHRGGW